MSGSPPLRGSVGSATIRSRIRSVVTLALVAVSGPAFAGFALTVEPDRVEVGDTFNATFTYDGDPAGLAPDFSLLTQDFRIRATSMSTRHQIVNGMSSASVAWTLSLEPLRAGDLQIPSITLHNEHSPARQVHVAALDPQLQALVRDEAFFTDETTPAAPYVQGQITYTRRLYQAGDARLYGELPDVPIIANAIVQSLASPTFGTEQRNGHTYRVIAQRFAVFPQASGELLIPSVSVQSSVRGRDGRRHQAVVASAALRVHVQPVPDDYPAAVPWLPAQSLTLRDLTAAPPAIVNVGDPIVRTIELRATGLPASALPALPLADVENVKRYADPPQPADSGDGQYITGTRTETITWVPTRAGALWLPAINVRWWDVGLRMQRVASLPPTAITVRGGPLAVAPTPGAHQRLTRNLQLSAPANARRSANPIGPHPVGVAWQFAAAAVVVLAFMCGAVWRARAWQTHPARGRARRRFATCTTLRAACSTNDPILARRALAGWLAERWQMSGQAALTLVAIEPAVAELNAAVFADPAVPWRGDALRAWVKRVPVPPAKTAAAPARSVLPPLYPASTSDAG